MANERLIFEVVAEGKNLKAVQLDAHKLADGVERTSDAYKNSAREQERYHRGAKGVAGTSANTTKNFSKMRSAMGGSSGIVAAYATLAANVFAVTAAFNALRRAAAFEELSRGLEFVGRSAGQNLGAVVDGLKEITGAAVSTEQAMRTTAVGLSAGFNSSQLEDLTRVAKGASLALGRDLGDALDRLVRGTAKLEPEILDELGIMVRLDDATEAYAASIGKTSSALTRFERQQAFLNATTEQGLKKFGQIAKELDPNPYDRLSAAFDNLVKSGLKIVNMFLTPLVEALAESQGMLLGVGTAFVGTISGQMLPGMMQMAATTATMADETRMNAAAQLQSLGSTRQHSAGITALLGKIHDGTASTKEYNATVKQLNQSIDKHTRDLENMNTADAGYAAGARRKNKMIGDQRATLNDLNGAFKLQLQSSAEFNASNAIGAASSLDFRGALEGVTNSFADFDEKQKTNIKGSKKQNSILAFTERAFFKAGVGARVFGAALMSAIPIIGIVITAASALYELLLKLIPEDKLKKSIDASTERIKEFLEANKQLTRFLASEGGDAGAEAAAAIKVYAGGVDGVVTSLNNWQRSEDTLLDKRLKALKQTREETEKSLDNLRNQGTATGAIYDLFFGTGTNTQVQLEQQQKISDLIEEETRVAKEATDNAVYDRAALNEELQRNINMLIVSNNKYVDTTKIVEKLQAMQKEISGQGPLVAMPESRASLIQAVELVQRYNANVQNAENVTGELNKELASIHKKAATPYSKMMAQITEMGAALDTAMQVDAEGLLGGELSAVASQMKVMEASELFGKKGETAQALQEYISGLQEAEDQLIKLPIESKRLLDLSKQLTESGKANEAIYRQQLALEKQAADLKAQSYARELQLAKAAASIGNDSASQRIEAEKRVAEVRVKMLTAQQSMMSSELEAVKILTKQLEIQKTSLDLTLREKDASKSITNARKENARITQEIKNLESKTSTGSSAGLTPMQEAKIQADSAEQQKIDIREGADIRRRLVDNEFDLIEAQDRARKEDLKIKKLVAIAAAKETSARLDTIQAEGKAAIARASAQAKDGTITMDEYKAISNRWFEVTDAVHDSKLAADDLADSLATALANFTGTDVSAARAALKSLIDIEEERDSNAVDRDSLAREKAVVDLYREQTGILEMINEIEKHSAIVKTDKFTTDEKITMELMEQQKHIIKMNELEGQRLDLVQKEFDAIKNTAMIESKRKRLANTALTDTQRQRGSAFEEQQARKKAEEAIGMNQEEIINKSYEAEKAKLEAEKTITETRMALLREEYTLIDAQLEAAAAIAKTQGKDTSAIDAARGSIAAGAEQASLRMFQQQQKLAEVQQQRLDTLKEETAEKQAQNKLSDEELAFRRKQEAVEAATGEGNVLQRMAAFRGAGGFGEGADELGLGDKLKVMKGFSQEMIDNLRQLSPEGEVMATAVEGAFAVGNAWSGVADVFARVDTATTKAATGMEKGAAVAQAVGQTLGQINQIMQASDQARINKIDKAITAEKKKDGKSKESLEKIKQMEKKKEQMERKAFERNKKMQMGMIIANTAAAVMGVLSGVKDPLITAPLALAQVALFTAMGVAQLAAVAGTSYEGGGSIASSGATPKSVSVGDRNNKVDVARGGNVGGELAYLRGERGTGSSASDFRPSFGGRYRAAGGTAYMVGEQGPELFVPETPGRIMEQEDSAPNMGGVVNANFTIQAIDATNMQETLTAQRGNIIGMIREAANASGETFLETVDTLGLTSQGAE